MKKIKVWSRHVVRVSDDNKTVVQKHALKRWMVTEMH